MKTFDKPGRCHWHDTVLVERLPEAPGTYFCFPCAAEATESRQLVPSLPPVEALKELVKQAESYVNLSRTRGHDLRPEAADQVRNALAAAKASIAAPPADVASAGSFITSSHAGIFSCGTDRLSGIHGAVRRG